MVNRKIIGMLIAALVIGVTGFGIGTYSIFKIIQLKGTDSNLVAVWEDLSGSGTNFNIVLNNNQVNNSEYFSMADGNTSVILTQPGWYKFTISICWTSLDSEEIYHLQVLKNGIVFKNLEYLENVTNFYNTINNFVYVFSDGDDIINIRCFSGSGHSSISDLQAYNQITLEYVEEL